MSDSSLPPSSSSSTASSVDVKGTFNEAAQKDRVNIRTLAQDGTEVSFAIRSNTPMGKLMAAYCQKNGVSPQQVRFMFNGMRVQPDQTAKELEMENDDIIDVMVEQTGGGFN